MNPGGSRRDSGQPATIRARLKYPDEKAFIKQYARYVTRTELFLKTAKPKAEGTTVRFDLQIANGDSVLRGIGVVAWHRLEATAEGPAGMGVKFQKLDAKSKETIKRILALKKARAGAGASSMATDAASKKTAASSRQKSPAEPTTKSPAKDEKQTAPKRARRSEAKLDDIDSMLAEISAERADRPQRRSARTAPLETESAAVKEQPARERRRRAASEAAVAERPRRASRRRTDSDLDALLERPARRIREQKPTQEIELEAPRETPAFEAKPEPEFVPDDEKTRPDVRADSILPPREAIAPEEPELMTAPGVEIEEKDDDEEFDIDGLIENTFVEVAAPKKPLEMDSGYIAIRSIAPDMPGINDMPADEAIFAPADEVTTERPVKKAEDVVISEDAARLTDAFLDTVDHFGSDVDNDDEFDEPLGIIIDDDSDDDEEIDIEATGVDLTPAKLDDETTQLELGDETSDSLLDALASANADNRIGKDRLNSLIDEMTQDSSIPDDPAAPDLLGTNDVSSALDEIFVSVDGEDDVHQPLGIDNAPMTLPDNAVPADLVRPRPDTTGLELEELTDEDEVEKGRRISFFKKLFGG